MNNSGNPFLDIIGGIFGELESVEVNTTTMKGRVDEEGLTLNFKGIKTERPKEFNRLGNVPSPDEIDYRISSNDISDDFDENDYDDEFGEDEIYED